MLIPRYSLRHPATAIETQIEGEIQVKIQGPGGQEIRTHELRFVWVDILTAPLPLAPNRTSPGCFGSPLGRCGYTSKLKRRQPMNGPDVSALVAVPRQSSIAIPRTPTTPAISPAGSRTSGWWSIADEQRSLGLPSPGPQGQQPKAPSFCHG